MSIWNASVQKLDIAKALWFASEHILKNVLGKNIAPYLRPKGAMHGLATDSTWDELARECEWKDSNESADNNEIFDGAFGTVKRWYVGIDAVYHLVHAIYSGRFQSREKITVPKIESVTKALGSLVVDSTQITPKRFLEVWNTIVQSKDKIADQCEAVSEALKKVKSRSDTLEEIDQLTLFGEGTRVYYGYVMNDLVLLRGASEFIDQGLVLTMAHLDLMTGALIRLANIRRYAITEYSDNSAAKDAIIQMLELTLKTAVSCRAEKANWVVRAFHKARAYAQMLLLENKQTGALEDAIKDYQSEGLQTILPLNEYLAVLDKIKMPWKNEVLHVYKWMPPPDFDATYAFEEVRTWHYSARSSGADPGASTEQRELWKMVKTERKMNFASAYKRMTSEWPEGLSIKGTSPNLKTVANWEPENLLPYYSYGKDIVAQVKDKAIVKPTAKEELEKPARAASESFLIWYMKNGSLVDTDEDLKLFATDSLPEENYVRAAYKPEAHKPGSRLFFIAPPRQRILLGELEGNLSRVAGCYPGSLQGRSSADKSRIIANIMDPHTTPPEVQPGADVETYIVTFDLSKFSPRSNYFVTADYHLFWAKVFGKPELESLKKIGTQSKIIHTTAGLKMQYQNKGADLEGFRGRMMTMFHADMLAAACRLARARGYTEGKAVLAVFIDDGAVKVAAKGSDAEVLKSINGFLTCMKEIYEAAGQENHPNKTVISKVGGEILAEFYYKKIKMPAGIKAAMRLAPTYENPACAISEEFDAMFATTQGSIKDGAKWIESYARYAVSFVKNISRWCRKEFEAANSVKLAIRLLTPKSFGGFGFPSLQSLVTTAATDATVEGLGILNTIGRYHITLRPEIAMILNRATVQRSPLAILRDPTRIRKDTPVIIENRLTMTIVSWLETYKKEELPFLAAYRNLDLIDHATSVAKAILRTSPININFLKRAWKLTPLSYVESVVGKFKRAGTIINFLNFKTIGTIRKKNLNDVKQILSDCL